MNILVALGKNPATEDKAEYFRPETNNSKSLSMW